MLKKIAILIAIAAVAVPGLALGCSKGETAEEEDRYSIKVELDGELIATLYVEDIDTLETDTFSDEEGVVQEGPSLAAVLAHVGVSNYTSITFKGMARGRVATAEKTMTKAEIEGQTVLLDKTNQGTYKLTGSNILKDDNIVDVNTVAISKT